MPPADPSDVREPWRFAVALGAFMAVVLLMLGLTMLFMPPARPGGFSSRLALCVTPGLLYGILSVFLWKCQKWALTALIVLDIVHMGAVFLGVVALFSAIDRVEPGAVVGGLLLAVIWLIALAQHVAWLHRSEHALRLMTDEPRGFEPILRRSEVGARSDAPAAQQPAAETPGSGAAEG
jgi:hypothetical protein